MGKRSDFDRNPRDFYPTPYEAVLPLLRHVHGDFIEPCAGDGRLVKHLEKNGLRCTYACDLEPQPPAHTVNIEQKDVLFFGERLPPAALIITNPPWEREVLHAMIDKFRHHAPTWLLFDAAWMFTEQASPFAPYCKKIVAVGRISWMGNGVSSMDDCCWYHFTKQRTRTQFVF